MSSLAGTWELIEWTATVGERLQRPFGGDVVGKLTYTVDGHMWAALMRRDRRPVGATTLAGATASDRAAAAAGYLNYAGTYTDLGDRVVHHVEVSLMPNWVGKDQERIVRWVDGDLELSTDPETGRSGEPIINRLRWRRVSG
ncbi:MAG TPA: lipocalin-like domain-containing protein [Acidimicrobiia bacterium]|nr:lipocalin-like domain-containing protein [Acidimicrobiia bacterium]